MTEFYVLQNGSIFVSEWNSTIRKEEYFMKENGAMICIDNVLKSLTYKDLKNYLYLELLE